MDENGLMKGKRRNFKLPESVSEKIEEKDEIAAKRELYVAITRAKDFVIYLILDFLMGDKIKN